MENLRLDQLPPASGGATRNHIIAAMKDGQTVFLTTGQVLDLLIGAAPGALDTLDELAAALGDDANFAATVTAALAGKAPLVSPSFSGNPTTAAPPAGDSDTSIPNTAWVQGELAINSLTEKTTPVDADQLRIADSAASNAAKKLTFANLWAWARAKVLALLNASGSAPVYAARAWVNFNGTGTVAIRGSGNVSSITDNGTGDYTVNLITAMPDANYAADLTIGREGTDTTSVLGVIKSGRTASAVSVNTFNSSFANVDCGSVNLTLFG